MKLPHPLTPGLLLRRYKRFLANLELYYGSVVTAPCPLFCDCHWLFS